MSEDEDIPIWMWILVVSCCVGGAALFIGMSLGDTKNVTETVTRYIPDPNVERLTDELSNINERLDIADRPSDPNYRLCDWSDFDCEEGVDYIEKDLWEKND